ncbi:MAG TPA: hypothetical protein VE914_00660 [Candidatus Angelobacter sp.]|nr:hypothetical protein [Candidatus Angelobacter sp.]
MPRPAGGGGPGPGTSIDGLIGYSNYDSDVAFVDYSTLEVGLGTSIAFWRDCSNLGRIRREYASIKARTRPITKG